MATNTLVMQADKDRVCADVLRATAKSVRCMFQDDLALTLEYAATRLAQASTDRPTSELEAVRDAIVGDCEWDEAQRVAFNEAIRLVRSRITALEATIAHLQAGMKEAVKELGQFIEGGSSMGRIEGVLKSLTTLLSDAPEDRGEDFPFAGTTFETRAERAQREEQS